MRKTQATATERRDLGRIREGLAEARKVANARWAKEVQAMQAQYDLEIGTFDRAIEAVDQAIRLGLGGVRGVKVDGLDKVAFRAAVKEYCAANGCRLIDVADAIGVSRRYLYNWMSASSVAVPSRKSLDDLRDLGVVFEAQEEKPDGQ